MQVQSCLDHSAAMRYVYAVADPTLSDVMAALHRIDLQNQQQTSLLIALTNGVQLMSQPVTDTAAAVSALDTKVDTLIAAVTPALQTLRDSLAAALAQVAALQAGDAADAAALGETIAAANTEAGKVQAAIDALNPPAPAP